MNKKTFTNKKKAFSLIELSIVLIIIGLLVAGVTGGASLIKNAELRSLMTEARGYQTAVNAFYERFQDLPGDFGTEVGGSYTLGTATVAGNANGQIEFYNSNATSTTVAGRMESNIAWQQLKNGSFVDATFTPATGNAGTSGVVNTTTLTPGTNIPGSKTKNAGWIFDYVSSQNVVIVTNAITPTESASTSAVAAVPTAIIIPVDALSIDTKLDDGVATTGKVRGMLGATDVSSSGCYDTDSSPYSYATALSSAQCALSFQVDPGQ